MQPSHLSSLTTRKESYQTRRLVSLLIFLLYKLVLHIIVVVMVIVTVLNLQYRGGACACIGDGAAPLPKILRMLPQEVLLMLRYPSLDQYILRVLGGNISFRKFMLAVYRLPGQSCSRCGRHSTSQRKDNAEPFLCK